MSINVPVTIWTPDFGNGEMALAGGKNITTLSGRLFTTLGGVFILTKNSSYSPIPSTIWAENDAV